MRYYITPEQWNRIPDDYKTEHSDRGGRACFVCFLTETYDGPGSTLCFENEHFIIGPHREYTEVERNNGGHAVACFESKPARDLYDSGLVDVWEYHNPERPVRLDRTLLYAYQYGEEYGEDLTGKQLEDTLGKLQQHHIQEVREEARV